MRNRYLLFAASAVVVLLFAAVFLHVRSRAQAFDKLRAAEQQYQKERSERVRMAAAARANEAAAIAAARRAEPVKRTPLGDGSIQVPVTVVHSGLYNGETISASLIWPDHFQLDYGSKPSSESLRDAKSEKLADGTILQYGILSSSGKDFLQFLIGGVAVRLKDSAPASRDRALATLRTFRSGSCLDCELPAIHRIMTTPQAHLPRPLPH